MSILLDSNGRPVFLSGGAIARPGAGTPPGGGGTKTLLTQADFNFLGWWGLNYGGEFSYGKGLAHFYNNSGQLRFFAIDNSNGNGAIRVLTPPASFSSETSTSSTIGWSSVSGLAYSTGRIYGLQYDIAAERLHIHAAIDYPSDPQLPQTDVGNYVSISPSLTVGTVSGRYGIENVTARRLYGGMIKVPAWFQSAFGVGGYAMGFGGYASRMTSARVSMGPYLAAVPDVDATIGLGGGSYTAAQVKLLMNAGDNAAGGTDWYAGTGNTVPTTYDRGHRIAGRHLNFYDTGGAYPSTPSPSWATGPEGNGRFTWGDSYYSNCVWLDGTSKHGLLMVPVVHLGNTWYQTSTLNWDDKGVEFHIFDPDKLGEVAAGTRASCNVQPSSMWVPADIPTRGSGATGNGQGDTIAGVTFDPTTSRLYLRRTFASGFWPNTRDRIYVYEVNL